MMIALAGLGACAPKAAAPPPAPALDCARGFVALSQAVAATPGMTLAPRTPGEPYRFYNAGDGKTSYMVTEVGAPGHPAILMQSAAAGAQQTTGCPFGDRGGYDQLLGYLKSLSGARRP